ncbi:hypothetical protein RHMOL_Rhmol12G0170100 [Rhododendron molle]|uniref:Uncharacterized protein n=1 Tax=Rhododendron molle TaxID=49168 RepID=A0ACC0LJ03_RHOML|nr:hypothetical protein RHMOL_Rhmol12G0170100 [Rhododendron molle]
MLPGLAEKRRSGSSILFWQSLSGNGERTSALLRSMIATQGTMELYEILREADAKCSAKSFKCEDWKKFLPKECFQGRDGRVSCFDVYSVGKLIEALGSGLKLPAIRTI